MNANTIANLTKVAEFCAANMHYTTQNEVDTLTNKLKHLPTAEEIIRYALGKETDRLASATGVNVSAIVKNAEQRTWCANKTIEIFKTKYAKSYPDTAKLYGIEVDIDLDEDADEHASENNESSSNSNSIVDACKKIAEASKSISDAALAIIRQYA